MADDRKSEAALTVANAELATVREAMRELNRMVDSLERGERQKLVLTRRNRMRAVLISIERFAELEAAAEAGTLHPISDTPEVRPDSGGLEAA